MKKRIVALCLLAVMLLGLVSMTGCNGAANNKNAEPNFVVPEAGFNPDEPVTITFAHTMGAKPLSVLTAYIEEFNKIYPNITVVQSSYGGWSDINGQINTEIAGGNQPNLAYCYPDHVAMYNIAKSVVTLDNLIASEFVIPGTNEVLGLTQEQIDDFVESYYNEGKAYGDGLMYTMPMSKSTEVLFYDKTFFQEHNLKVPETWDEMWQVCEQILAIDPDCYPLGYDSEANWFITMCEQMNSGYTSVENGGEFLFDNEANRNFVKELREYYQKGYFTTQELYGSYTSNLFVEQVDTRCYMGIGSTGGTSYQMSNNDTTDGSFAFEVGVAPLPQYNAEHKAAISQGPSLCILKGKDTTDQQIMASWLFVKFLCTNIDFQAEFSMKTGYSPVLKSVTENEIYANWLAGANGYEELVALGVRVGIDTRDYQFVSPAFVGSSKARVQVGSLLIKCISEDLAGSDLDAFVKTAFQDAIDECEY